MSLQLSSDEIKTVQIDCLIDRIETLSHSLKLKELQKGTQYIYKSRVTIVTRRTR